ncbi:TVP38/TMEM64 family protein [Euhalothece natronophila Z-M001]|uniref:TVP38/TMEM64 family membrane protein n=1 Tax=Euhalothece natronophila Z-M001 TaxID=522448 RepID=A0A5B8NQU9_9CHRO|nr:TVP38/TMEM64 family protein [Euhalothece natronophila]QDZ41337.1 TVP38/TMEM64 family protein [Euhalothece natronophila Z-M001]
MNNTLKYTGIAVIVTTLIVSTQFIDFQGLLTNTLQWIDDLGPLAAIVFIAIYMIATVLFFPASILTLGAGVVFGVVLGSIYVFIAASIGASLAFLVGRYVARGWVEKQIEGNPRFKSIDQAVAEEGMKIVLLTRLSPVFPFNLLNYAYGLTKVSFKDYVLGTLGILPGTIMFVYVGSLAGNLATIGAEEVETPGGVEWAIRIIGLLATVGVTIYVTKIARKALNQRIEPEASAE